MRRIVLIVASVAAATVLLMLDYVGVLACDITVAPSSPTGYVGEQETVAIQVKLTHRNCVTPIEETLITATGATIVSQTPWQTVDSQTYRKSVTVRLDREGQATITAVRDCPKGGDTSQATIRVLAAGAEVVHTAPSTNEASTGQVASAATRDTQPSDGDGGSSVNSGSTSDNTGAQSAGSHSSPGDNGSLTSEPNQTAVASLEDTAGTIPDNGQVVGQSSARSASLSAVLTEPRTLALLALTVVAGFGFATGNHRLRVLTLLASLGYLGFISGGCLCPLGAFQKLFIGLDSINQRLLGYVTLAIPIVTALLLGRLYCGWICPAGALQELLHRHNVAVAVPAPIDRWLRQLKYFLLIALIWVIRLTGEPVFEGTDPFKVAFNFSGDTASAIILALILAASLFLYRPWCRYLCPMGALLGLVSRLSVFRLTVSDNCVSCKACTRACGVQALEMNPSPPKRFVDDYECLRCADCRQSCRKAAIAIDVRLKPTLRLVPIPKTSDTAVATLISMFRRFGRKTMPL